MQTKKDKQNASFIVIPNGEGSVSIGLKYEEVVAVIVAEISVSDRKYHSPGMVQVHVV
jgi:hypothetical protein